MYELTVVMDGASSTNKLKSLEKEVSELVNVMGGKVVDTNSWGKKQLAYKIGKATEGYFTNYLIELPTESVNEVQTKLNLNENVVRHLIVKSKNKASENKKQAKATSTKETKKAKEKKTTKKTTKSSSKTTKTKTAKK